MLILETPNGFYVGEDGYVIDRKSAKRFNSVEELPDCVSEQDKRAFAHPMETPDFYYITEADTKYRVIRYDRWLKREYADPFTEAPTEKEALELAEKRDSVFFGTTHDPIKRVELF